MKINILYLLAVILFFSSCKKNNASDPVPTPQDSYINTNSGSTWAYHETNSSGATPANSDYTITSSAKDTIINNKSYHIYDYSYGGSQYLNISGHNYYQFDSIPGGLGQIFERLYLKDDVAIGVTWDQSLSIPIQGFPISAPVTITNKIMETGISRTVNGINYTDLIHVSTSISSSVIPEASLTSDIQSYYAKKYGLIENTSVVSVNYLGIVQNINISTKLTSATLK